MQTFSKEAFKKSIIDNVKNQYRRTIDEATPQMVFQAVSYAIKDVIIDNWIATQKAYDEKKAPRSAKRTSKKEEAAPINNVAASTSLGDFDALAALKAQMEQDK